jgi:hypothetical protein
MRGSVLAPLKALQDILHNRITQKKGEENSKKNLLFFLKLNSIFELDTIDVILNYLRKLILAFFYILLLT